MDVFCVAARGDNLDDLLAERLDAGAQAPVNHARNIFIEAAIDDRLNAVRRKPVLIGVVGVVLEDFGFHDALNLLQQRRSDGICVHAAGEVHGSIVAVAELVVGLSLAASGEGCAFVTPVIPAMAPGW